MLTAEAAGFSRFVQQNIVLQVAGDVTVDAMLSVGALNEAVVVKETPAALQFNTSTMQMTVEMEMACVASSGSELCVNGGFQVNIRPLEPHGLAHAYAGIEHQQRHIPEPAAALLPGTPVPSCGGVSPSRGTLPLRMTHGST